MIIVAGEKVEQMAVRAAIGQIRRAARKGRMINIHNVGRERKRSNAERMDGIRGKEAGIYAF